MDDTPDHLELVSGLLKDKYRVKVANDGARGLTIASGDDQPDLILLDILMPGIDGYEFCRRLKQAPKTASIPVIFLTVKSDVEDESCGLEMGAADYITKPISPPILLARVKTHLALKAAADALMDKNAYLDAEVRQRTREIERMMRALAENESKFRALTEQAIVGIYTADQGIISYMNPRAAAIFGYEVEEAIGRPAHDFIADKDWQLVQDNMRKHLDGETEDMRYEFEGRRKDGSAVMIGVHGKTAVIEDRKVITGVLQDITERVRSAEQIRGYVAKIERMVDSTLEAISTLVDQRDPYTAGHERRVGGLAAAIAGEMGLDANMQRGLLLAGAVHDVGKVGVPAELLAKPSRLTPIELSLIRTHAHHGYEVLRGIDSPWPIAEVARQHHERMDGSGYPRQLCGDKIILEARIMSVADVVEAMSSHRPYRPSLGIDAALKEIEKNCGKHFDTLVVAACVRLFRDKGYTLPT